MAFPLLYANSNVGSIEFATQPKAWHSAKVPDPQRFLPLRQALIFRSIHSFHPQFLKMGPRAIGRMAHLALQAEGASSDGEVTVFRRWRRSSLFRVWRRFG
jgi:hypothetical protein